MFHKINSRIASPNSLWKLVFYLIQPDCRSKGGRCAPSPPHEKEVKIPPVQQVKMKHWPGNLIYTFGIILYIWHVLFFSIQDTRLRESKRKSMRDTLWWGDDSRDTCRTIWCIPQYLGTWLLEPLPWQYARWQYYPLQGLPGACRSIGIFVQIEAFSGYQSQPYNWYCEHLFSDNNEDMGEKGILRQALRQYTTWTLQSFRGSAEGYWWGSFGDSVSIPILALITKGSMIWSWHPYGRIQYAA